MSVEEDEAGAAQIRRRLEAVRSRIASAGADPQSVKVVAVSKGFGMESVVAASRAGLVDLGENYAQDLLRKAAGAADSGIGVRWHFVGSIQRNKVRSLAPLVHLWHGLSRPVEGEDIARASPGARVLVQVDFVGRAGRGGVPASEAPGLVGHLTGLDLDVRGLMTVAPRDELEARVAFRRLADLRERLGLDELSMGMSEDLEIAVREGATIVRIGSALFGPRRSPGGLRQ